MKCLVPVALAVKAITQLIALQLMSLSDIDHNKTNKFSSFLRGSLLTKLKFLFQFLDHPKMPCIT